MASTSYTHPVVTDLTILFSSSPTPPSACAPAVSNWHRLDKELYLYQSQQRAWLYVAVADADTFSDEDALVLVDIRLDEPPADTGLGGLWEERPAGIWIQRQNFSGCTNRPVTAVDVLFGEDAIDARPQWKLLGSPLRLGEQPGIPVARLSVLFGRTPPISSEGEILRINGEGKFKVVQISDTHMVTGAGVCRDALGANAEYLPESEADPLTMQFMREILDIEKPDLVVFTGDPIHHDVLDTKTALFKAVAPVIERSIPFALVFGNHDSEGVHALSRKYRPKGRDQMAILKDLPFNLSDAGPEEVAGTGNFRLDILAPAPSHMSLSTLYFLDSHGQIRSETREPDYDTIKQSQIDWFLRSCQEERSAPQESENTHLRVVFQHIPLPEFTDSGIRIRNGHLREPPEGPIYNSGFYDAMSKEGVSAFACGHDHVNDFCALLSRRVLQDGETTVPPGPWLCYGGSSGFGGYCSYDRVRYHRMTRIWQLDTKTGSLMTWKRVEHNSARVDELLLVENGIITKQDWKNIEA